MIKYALLFAGSFLLGSVPTALLAARKLKGIDIRKHGSGNVGATNAFRVLGKKAGLFVFAVDFLKGAAPAWAAIAIFGAGYEDPRMLALGAGLAAVLGHIYNPFLGFKGGKGVATGAGALCGSYPPLFFVAAMTFGVLFYFSRIVSLSSLAAIAILVPGCWIHTQDGRLTSLFFALFILLCWTHRQNIQRLMRGEERPIVKK